jgi:hypothetical protein
MPSHPLVSVADSTGVKYKVVASTVRLQSAPTFVQSRKLHQEAAFCITRLIIDCRQSGAGRLQSGDFRSKRPMSSLNPKGISRLQLYFKLA